MFHEHGTEDDCVHCTPPQDERNVVEEMFDWWNQAYTADSFTEDGLAAFFAEDVIFLVNNALRARNLPELRRHFEGVKARTDSVVMQLPLEETFSAGEKAFVHYRCVAREPAGTHTENAMASVTTRNGRIQIMKVVCHTLEAEQTNPRDQARQSP